MEKSMRQLLLDEICNLQNDFRLLFLLRHYHQLALPMKNIIEKLRECKKLLIFYPTVKCLDCGKIIN